MLFSIRPSSTALSLPVLPTCWACLAIPGISGAGHCSLVPCRILRYIDAMFLCRPGGRSTTSKGTRANHSKVI